MYRLTLLVVALVSAGVQSNTNMASAQSTTTTSPSNMDPCSADASSPDNPLDVIVIGAGWAGLAAGNRLFRGFDNNNNNNIGQITDRFCILEGRHEIGGRSRTMMGVFHPDLPTELGSAWIYDGSNVFDIFQQAGLVTDVPSFFEFDNTGLYVEPNAFFSAGGMLQDDRDLRKSYGEWVKFAQKNARFDLSMKDLMDTYWLENPGLSNLERQTILALTTTVCHTEWGAYVAKGDSQVMADLLDPSYSIDFTGIPGSGFKPALDFFAAPFAARHIRLNSAVKEIDYSYPVVKVTSMEKNDPSSNTATTVVRYARSVICTVSLGVLQYNEINFVPPLPSWKTRAIQDMAMGNKNKCILYWDPTIVTDLSWWPDGQLEMQLITGQDEESNDWTFFQNDRNHRFMENHYVITAWIGGLAADKWESRSDEETLQHVMGNLRKLFPPPMVVPDPTKYVLTRWKSDPFTRGTYSYYSKGVDYGAAARALAETVGETLFFAGEASSPDGVGTPEAFYTGERAANWLLRSGVLERDIGAGYPVTGPTAAAPQATTTLPPTTATTSPATLLPQETTMPPATLLPQQVPQSPPTANVMPVAPPTNNAVPTSKTPPTPSLPEQQVPQSPPSQSPPTNFMFFPPYSPPTASLPPQGTQQSPSATNAVPNPPVSSAPVTSAPVSSAPVTSAPVSSSPVTSAPISSAPVTSAPISSAPVTSAPISNAPVTSAPVSSGPVSSVPVSSAPATSLPEKQPQSSPTNFMFFPPYSSPTAPSPPSPPPQEEAQQSAPTFNAVPTPPILESNEAPSDPKCGSVAGSSGYGGTAGQSKDCGGRNLRASRHNVKGA